MPIYWDCGIIVAETGGEAAGNETYDYAKYFSELYRKTGKVFKTNKVVKLCKGTHKIGGRC